MKKRLISLLLVLCLLLTMVPTMALAVEQDGENVASLKNPFADVKTSAWYYDAVQYVRINNIFNGVSDREFAPNGTMTRGMFVTVLGRMAGVDADGYWGTSGFGDVSADAYYAPYVAWASGHGITDGTGAGLFSPDAPVDRQQLATFIMRYLYAFDVDYYTDIPMTTEEPTDYHLVADWAKESVRDMWQTGLLQGDGVAFDPAAKATRAQMATLCTRLDEAVQVWYSEPGVESTRVRIDPATGLPYEENVIWPKVAVDFFDGDRLIDTLYTHLGTKLGELPAVEKSSKAGAVLLGYYIDEACTEPFYAEDPVMGYTKVYAKYQEMESQENLMPRTFTQLDQGRDLSFRIQRVSGAVTGEEKEAQGAATVTSIDGSAPVKLAARDNGDGTYTVYAENGFNEGCSYELTLSDGWVFSGKETTIRTAAFSIYMEEVENLRMGDDIVYIPDTDGMDYVVDGATHPVLTASVLNGLDTPNETGSFNYAGGDVQAGDLLCVYVGVHPQDRGNNADALDPAVYVKVISVSGGRVTFAALSEADQQELYEVPDNFPLRVDELPVGETGTFANKDALVALLDEPMYMSVLGEVEGSWEKALTRVSSGDFITLYTDLTQADPEDPTTQDPELYFAVIEIGEDGVVTYTRVEKQDILDSMDLYANISVSSDDMLSQAERDAMADEILMQVNQSGFAEETAFMLVDLITATDNFRQDMGVQDLLLTGEDGQPLADDEIELLAKGGSFELNDVNVYVDILGGDRYDGGTQIVIDVTADFAVEAEDGVVAIDLSASFVEEVDIAPGVKGDLVYKEILGIPIPIGVQVSANVDIRNFTAFDFAAEITTYDEMDEIVSETSVSSDLMNLMRTAENTGLSDEYYDTLDALMDHYTHLLEQETDWIKLVEEEIFSTEYFVYGLVIGVETDFVVRTDMSIAIGSSLSYEVGKRYSFWFKIGLFEPTAGSDTMDLLDEQFHFRFYVMGKLGVKAGIKAKVYVGIGSGELASVGIAAELGPYIKLWGFFIYDYSRTRVANTDKWITESNMTGGLNLEFGLYFILSFEAEALGLFEYSHDFLNKEYPLLKTGEPRYYYGLTYRAQDDEVVYMWDDDLSTPEITMEPSPTLRAVAYVNLQTGMKGNEIMGPENFSITLSNDNFYYNKSTGKIEVTVPDNVHYLACDMTITYLHGKMAFSNYDMTTTVPLVWTDLSFEELKEYHTVSVRVGDGVNYETVWSTRVLSGQEFDLPSVEQVKELAGWDELKYESVSGYVNAPRTKGLTVVADAVYDVNVSYRTYTINVSGIHRPDGTVSGESIPVRAKYGEVFNFDEVLGDTGFDVAGETYTRFKDVTTTEQILTAVENGVMIYEPMDLTRPITGKMAEALMDGTVQATANYVDDSVTAVFTFNGLVHEDVVVTTRKGTTPSMEKVTAVLDSEVRINGQEVGICDVSPKQGNIYSATHYIVTCVGLSGRRAMVEFDVGPGYYESPYYAPDPVEKLAGSVVVDIPTPIRRGYTFKGWFTDLGEDAYDQTVPEGGITLYAKWEANPYVVTYDLNGSDSNNVPEKMVVYYDDLYGEGYRYVECPSSESGYTIGEAYGELPFPSYTNKGFVGWSTMRDRKDTTTPDDRLLAPAYGARRAQETTVADIFDVDHTLYAQWKELVVIPQNLFAFPQQTTTYNGTDQASIALNSRVFGSHMQYGYETYDTVVDRNYSEDLGFRIQFKQDGRLTSWQDKAENAGYYDVLITRAADNDFAEYRVQHKRVLVINKANSSMSSVPSASNITTQYGANVLTNTSGIDQYTGDGSIQFATTLTESKPKEGDWTSGVLYNISTTKNGKSFYLWTRLSEGENYKASEPVRSAEKLTLNSVPTPITYKLSVKTGGAASSGTDAQIYVKINGGSQTNLPKKSDNHDRFENGDLDVDVIPVGKGYNDRLDDVDVTIGVVEGSSSNKPGWCMDWFRIDAYQGSELLLEGEKIDPTGDSQWFAAKEDGWKYERTYQNVSVYGRYLKYGISGPSSIDLSQNSTVTVSIDLKLYDNRSKKTMDVYQLEDAPEFVARFSHSGFDKLISWAKTDSVWQATFRTDDVRELMNQYGYKQLSFTYGVPGDPEATATKTIQLNNQ